MRTKDPQKSEARKRVSVLLRQFIQHLMRQFTTGADELLRRTESRLAGAPSENAEERGRSGAG